MDLVDYTVTIDGISFNETAHNRKEAIIAALTKLGVDDDVEIVTVNEAKTPETWKLVSNKHNSMELTEENLKKAGFTQGQEICNKCGLPKSKCVCDDIAREVK